MDIDLFHVHPLMYICELDGITQACICLQNLLCVISREAQKLRIFYTDKKGI